MGNDNGTVLSCIDVVRAVRPASLIPPSSGCSPAAIACCAAPAGPRVERVLKAIDAIEALDINPEGCRLPTIGVMSMPVCS